MGGVIIVKLTVRMGNYIMVSALCMAFAACGGSGSTTGSGAQTTGSTGSAGSAGGSGSTGGTGGTSGGGTTTPTNQERAAAASSTAANNQACTSLNSFYWEIGDETGALVSGTAGAASTTEPDDNTVMSIASSSKWMFSTYLAEKQTGSLTVTDINFLTFQSGYTNFNACSGSSTVSSCLSESGTSSGTNGTYIPANAGHFYYNGGHMQVLASMKSIAPDDNQTLAADMQSVLGTNVPIKYSEPQLAGGIYTDAATYAHFLRNMLSGAYPHMSALLGSNAVCTHTNSNDCSNAIFSPVNQSLPGGPNDVSNESWHYSIGHWVEDDPTVGDGSFSSPGRFGFYPWIDKSKTYYGVLARYDPANVSPLDPSKAAYYTSVQCGRLIRSAWIKGVAQ